MKKYIHTRTVKKYMIKIDDDIYIIPVDKLNRDKIYDILYRTNLLKEYDPIDNGVICAYVCEFINLTV